jgi:hypothetical protein
MLSRALSLATVTLLIGFAAKPAQAQNLEAGKSPSQIFAGACTACHKSPRGLLKTVPAGSLQGFLREHYTTSPEMASLLSAFLISNGAADTRYVGAQPREGREPKSDARPDGPPEQPDRSGRRLRPASPQEAAKPEADPRSATEPDADGLSGPAGGRRGRNAKRLVRPAEAPDAGKPAAEGQTPAQAATERGPDGRKLSAKRLGKRGKPGSEEPPSAEAAKIDAAKTDPVKTDAVKADAVKTDAAKTDAVKEEPAKVEAVTDDKPKGEPKGEPKSEAAKVEGGKPEGSQPSGEDKKPSGEDTKPAADKPETAKIEAPKEPGSGEPPTLRADPVPPVTPAPAASAAVSGGAPEPSTSQHPEPAPQPAVTASAPPLPPAAPAGPAVPPISK